MSMELFTRPRKGDLVNYRGHLYYFQPLYNEEDEVDLYENSLPFAYCLLYDKEEDIGKAWRSVFKAPVANVRKYNYS